MAIDRRTRAATESLTFLAVSAGILVLLNLLGTFAFHRFDTTERRLFTLSEGSKRLAASLTDDLEVTAYFTEDLPAPFNATEIYVRDLLEEYTAVSNGRIHVTFVHPDDDDTREAAQTDGVSRVQHLDYESGTLKEGYRGLVMHYLDKTEVVPVIEDTSGLEYLLTMRIKKMTGEQREIGVLGGHEGPTLTKGLSRIQACLPMYRLREVQATEEISRDLAALLVAEPHTTVTETELRRIDQYVMNGGSLAVLGGSMKIDLEGMEPAAVPVDTGMNRLIRHWGVTVEDGIVADARCERAPLQTNIGPLPVRHPPLPVVTFDEAQSEHPVLFRLDGALLPFTSDLNLVGGLNDDEVTVTTLARSSEQSWRMEGDSISLRPKLPREWTMEGPSGPFALIVAIEGKLPSAFAASGAMSGEGDEGGSDIEAPPRARRSVRVLVTGGAFFMEDPAVPPTDRGGECQMTSNLAFALNAVDWLAQDSDLIAIRAKNVEDPPIEVPENVEQAEDAARTAAEEAVAAHQEQDTERRDEAIAERDRALERRKEAVKAWDARKEMYRWGNMLGIPLVFGVFGLVRWQIRKSKRKNIKI